MKESSLKKMSLTTETKKIFGIDLGTTNSAIALRTASTVPTLIPLGKKDNTSFLCHVGKWTVYCGRRSLCKKVSI